MHKQCHMSTKGELLIPPSVPARGVPQHRSRSCSGKALRTGPDHLSTLGKGQPLFPWHSGSSASPRQVHWGMQMRKDCNDPPPQLAAWGVTTGRNTPSTRSNACSTNLYKRLHRGSWDVFPVCPSASSSTALGFNFVMCVSGLTGPQWHYKPAVSLSSADPEQWDFKGLERKKNCIPLQERWSNLQLVAAVSLKKKRYLTQDSMPEISWKAAVALCRHRGPARWMPVPAHHPGEHKAVFFFLW